MQIFFLVTELRDRGVGLRRGVSQPWAGELGGEKKREPIKQDGQIKMVVSGRCAAPAGEDRTQCRAGGLPGPDTLRGAGSAPSSVL